MKPPQGDRDGIVVLVGRGLAPVYPGAARAIWRMVRAKSVSFICRQSKNKN
jgi:hypothetical protein